MTVKYGDITTLAKFVMNILSPNLLCYLFFGLIAPHLVVFLVLDAVKRGIAPALQVNAALHGHSAMIMCFNMLN